MTDFFSNSSQEEKVLDYRPSIVYTPKDVITKDNTGAISYDQSLNEKEVSSISKRYLTNNITDLIKALNKTERIVNSLQADMNQYLLDSKYSISIINPPAFVHTFIENGVMTFERYQTIPNTSEYKAFHDIWFKESSSIRGNLVAEMVPFVNDFKNDIDRIKNIALEVILFETPFTLDSSEADLKKYILEMAERYENNFGLIRDAQMKRDVSRLFELYANNRKLESLFKFDTELNVLLKNGISMLEKPIEIAGRSVYKEMNGTFLKETLNEINGLAEETEINEKEIKVPVFFGFKNISNNIIKSRQNELTQYSVELKNEIEKRLLLLGKTWKNICIPDIAKYLDLGYNSSKILYHITNGIVDINSQLIESLKDYHKTNIGEMNNRIKIEKDIVYKNMARHIYNNLTGG